MKNKRNLSKEESIRRLQRSIRKFGDSPKDGETLGPKRKALQELQGMGGIDGK